jgi:hypothetical protein
MSMIRLAVFLLGMALLAGCGEVIVFGHTVRERPTSASKPEAQSDAAPAQESAPAAEAADAAGAAATAAAADPAAAAADRADAAATAATAASTSAGSTSSQSRAPATPSHVAHAVKAVSIVVTPEAAAKVTGDASRFTADALLNAIKAELKSRKLLDEHDPHASGTAEIVVDGLATRPTTNAVLFGYRMLAGTLEGDIRVTGASDTDTTGARIVAESRLTVSASGDDENPLGPLYRKFAVLAADRLAGIASRPVDPAGHPHL